MRWRQSIAWVAGVLSILASAAALGGPAVGVTRNLRGTPSVSLSAQCRAAAPPGTAACTQVQDSLAAERGRLASDVTLAKWYPVLNLGVSWRF